MVSDHCREYSTSALAIVPALAVNSTLVGFRIKAIILSLTVPPRVIVPPPGSFPGLWVNP